MLSHFITTALSGGCQVAFVSLFPRLHPFLLIVEEMG